MNREEERLARALGERLAALRRAAGLSQLALALKAKLAKNYLSDLECGRRNPSLFVLRRLAKALEVSLDDLFAGLPE